MLIKVTYDRDGIVVVPGSQIAKPFRAVTVAMTAVTFESDGIVGENVETSEKVKPPRMTVRRHWENAELDNGVYVNKRTREPVKAARGAYIVRDRVWYLPDDTR